MPQLHDKYGKMLLGKIAGKKFIKNGHDVKINYEGGISASIDGIINNCAIEVESRVDKQVRGAVLDLLEHPLPKKLLIIIPVHMHNPEATAIHCKYILNKYKKQDSEVKVVVLKGTGENPKEDEDKKLIEIALKDLKCL